MLLSQSILGLLSFGATICLNGMAVHTSRSSSAFHRECEGGQGRFLHEHLDNRRKMNCATGGSSYGGHAVIDSLLSATSFLESAVPSRAPNFTLPAGGGGTSASKALGKIEDGGIRDLTPPT